MPQCTFQLKIFKVLMFHAFGQCLCTAAPDPLKLVMIDQAILAMESLIYGTARSGSEAEPSIQQIIIS